MHLQWKKRGTINVYFSIFLLSYHKCNCDVDVRRSTDTVEKQNGAQNSSVEMDLSFSTICTTPNNTEGYCMPIHSCLALTNSRNAYSLNNSECGPTNQNRKDPKVCCQLKSYETTTLADINSPSPKICGFQNSALETRIVGGISSSDWEFPWLARLLRRNDEGDTIFSCTGALINSKAVLTTAHCLVSPGLDPIGSLYAVTLGEHNTECSSAGNNTCSQQRKTVIVSRSIAHPEYKITSRNHDNDIGIIILRDEVEPTSFITPICLLEENFQADEYFISGWGRTEFATVSSVKLKVSLRPFSWQQCADKYRTIRVNLTTHQICIGGEKNKDSCQGDSGGPLMIVKNHTQWFAAGLVSFGLGCGREGWPGIYINIPSYIEWIKSTIAQTMA